MTYITKKASMSFINLQFTLIQKMFKIAYINSHWIKHKMMNGKKEKMRLERQNKEKVRSRYLK